MIDIHEEIAQATAYFRDDAERKGLIPTSRLFVVLDQGGGWRCVVTPFWEIGFHLTAGERAIKVPRVRIAEPVEWNDVARTVATAERYATLWMIKRGYNAIPNPRLEVLE